MSVAHEIIIPYKPRREQLICHREIESHRFSVIVAHRGFGKSVLSVNHLIKKAAVGVADGVYGYIAPYRKQAKLIAWDYLKKYTAPIPGIEKNESDLYIKMPNGAKIGIYGADDPDSLRGIHWDGVVPDEVAQMHPEVWGEILRPGLASKKGFAVFIGTPKGMNLFHELYQQGLHDESWYVGFYPVTETQIFSAEELTLAKKSMTESQYAQEFLCDFAAACEDTLIRLDVVEAAANRKFGNHVFHNEAKIIGVDVARFGDDISVITKRQGVAVWEQIKLRGQQCETSALAGRIASEINEFKADGCFIDAGYNPGVIDMLRVWGYKITEVSFGGAPTDNYYLNKRAEMWARMRDWLATGGIPSDQMLKGELIAPTYDFKGAMGRMRLESKENMKDRGLASPNCADSLALTFAHAVQSNNFIGTQSRQKLKWVDEDNAKEWSPLDREYA